MKRFLLVIAVMLLSACSDMQMGNKDAKTTATGSAGGGELSECQQLT